MIALAQLVGMSEIKSGDFMETMETLANDGKDLGFVEAKQVVAAMNRCTPELTLAELERLRASCRNAIRYVERQHMSNAANDWTRILEGIEAKLASMPRP